MATHLRLGDIEVDVVLKDIKHVHLSVHPPTGKVRVSARSRMSLDTIRVFAIAKLGWTKTQQRKLRKQERERPREYLDRESHYVWGRRCLLKVVASSRRPSVAVAHRRMILRVRPAIDSSRMQAVVDQWYRNQVRKALPALLAKWQPLLGVDVDRIVVRRMRTRWGSCSPRSGSIRLNTDLAKKPPECLEYVVVHEMIHLIEPTHNARFVALMDRSMPEWWFHRAQLNRLPVRHERWTY